MSRRKPKSRKRRSHSTRTSPQQASTTQRRFIRGLLLILAAVLIIVFIFGDHGLYQLVRLKSERADIQERITELRTLRQELEAEKTRLETDPDYIEKLAREKYRMAKPGEKVFKVIEKKSGDNNN